MYILEVHEDSIQIGDKLVEINAVSIRFMRRIQISQYEPAEVEFTLHATLDEGEEHVKAGKKLAKDCRSMIKEAFTGLVKAAGKETETPPKAAPPKAVGRPKGSPNKAKAEKEVVTPSSEIPGEASPPLADADLAAEADGSEIPDMGGAPPVVDGPPVSEIPGDDPPVVPVAEKPLTLKELQAFITDQVTKAKVLTSGNIKDVLGTFNLGRTADLGDEQVPLFKDALDLLIAQVAKK